MKSELSNEPSMRMYYIIKQKSSYFLLLLQIFSL